MRMVEMNWNPSDRELRRFGMIGVVVLPLLAFFWGLSAGWIVIFSLVAWIFATAGLAWPRSLKPIFIGLSLVGLPLGFVGGAVGMAVVYFLILTPLALVFRLLGRDALQRRLDHSAQTYWQPRPQSADAAGYFRQF
jgi:hypothetical protein